VAIGGPPLVVGCWLLVVVGCWLLDLKLLVCCTSPRAICEKRQAPCLPCQQRESRRCVCVCVCNPGRPLNPKNVAPPRKEGRSRSARLAEPLNALQLAVGVGCGSFVCLLVLLGSTARRLATGGLYIASARLKMLNVIGSPQADTQHVRMYHHRSPVAIRRVPTSKFRFVPWNFALRNLPRDTNVAELPVLARGDKRPRPKFRYRASAN
jgi:hypothetical protein